MLCSNQSKEGPFFFGLQSKTDKANKFETREIEEKIVTTVIGWIKKDHRKNKERNLMKK